MPAREKSRQRQFRVNDQVGAPTLCLIHKRQHSPHNAIAPLGALDRTHLGGGDINYAHGLALLVDTRTDKIAAVRESNADGQAHSRSKSRQEAQILKES